MLEILLQYVLPSMVAGGLGLLAIQLGKARDRKAAEEAAKLAREAAEEAAKQERINEQFPGWAELVEENRNLRSELSGVRQLIDDLRLKVESMLAREARVMAAVARIFRRIEALWPNETGPDLDPADITILEDSEVLPPRWIRRK